MGLDMYLYVFGVRDSGPVALQVLAWSFGVSSSEKQEQKEAASKCDSVEKLSAYQVGEWLASECSISEETIKRFAQHEIDGVALLHLTQDDLKELEPKLGPRRRIEAMLKKMIEKSKSKVQVRELSVTSWATAGAELALNFPLLKSQILPRVVLVVYTRKYRGDGDHDTAAFLPGTGTQMIDMRDVMVSSISTGGSGGENRLTLNVCFGARTMSMSNFSVLDFRDVAWETYGARLLNVDPSDERWNPKNKEVPAADRALGVTVTYRGGDQVACLTEWGKHVVWSRALHSVYSEEFRTAVRTLLLCTKRPQECPWYRLPRDLLLLIFKYLARNYSGSPLDEFPYPKPSALINGEDEY